MRGIIKVDKKMYIKSCNVLLLSQPDADEVFLEFLQGKIVQELVETLKYPKRVFKCAA